MVSDLIHIFSKRSKYIVMLFCILIAGMTRSYIKSRNGNNAGLIMYTGNAPAGVTVKHDNVFTKGEIDILIDEGDNLATKKFIRQFSIIDRVDSISNPINIRPTDGAKVNFKLGLPLTISFKLSDKNRNKNIHIIYHAQVNENQSAIGVLSKRSYSIEDGVITFKAKHFGNYQFVTIAPLLESNHMRSTNKLVFAPQEAKYRIQYSNWK